MSKSRRSFLSKITLGAVAAGLTPKSLLANNNNSMNWKTKNIKPLGFQWETRDPFLFCVHQSCQIS